jgi:hypothetical protein
VQADRGLPGAGRTLDAHGLAQPGADDLVLVGLDGRDDVAHRAGARALDLLGEEPALLEVAALVEPLVFVGGQVAAVIAEPAAAGDVHRVRGAGLIERPGDRSPPVDHQRAAAVVVDVPAPDVDDAGQVVVRGAVETAEEQGRAGVVGERLHPLVQQRLQDLLGDPVAGGVGGKRLGVFSHRAQRGSGGGEVCAFGGEGLGWIAGYVGGQLMCGHAEAPPIR